MKRLLYYISVLLFSLLLLTGVLIASLGSEQVQNSIARLVTEELSYGLGANASIGHIEYLFPARVRIHDICLEDQQGDTLAYIQQMYAHFRPLPLLKNQIRFSRVDIRGVRGRVYTLPDGEYNYAFLAKAFQSDDDEPSSPFRSLLSIRDIHVDDVQFRWDDYQLLLSTAELDLSHFTHDSLDGEIKHLKGSLRYGGERLVVEDFKAHIQKTDTTLCFPTLMVRLPQSEIDASGVSLDLPKGAVTTHGAMHGARVKLHTKTAVLHPADIALFVPALKTIDGELQFTGDLEGSVDSIAAENLSLSYNGERLILGNVSVVGLPDIEKARAHIQCQDIYVKAPLIEAFLSDFENKAVSLPAAVHRLGEVHFKGDIDGKIHNMHLNGGFHTALGDMLVNGQFAADSAWQNLRYNAKMSTGTFRLGEMLGTTEVGNLNGDIKAEGTMQTASSAITTKLSADIRSIYLHGYNYQGIHIDGHYEPKLFDGLLSINDPNVQLNFNGKVNMRGTYPDIDCALRLRQFRPAALKLYTKVPDLAAGGAMRIKLSGTDIDHMNGSADIDSLRISNGKQTLHLRHLSLTAQAENGLRKRIRLTNAYLSANIDGVFRYEDLGLIAQRAVHRLLPPALAASWGSSGQKKSAPQGSQHLTIDVNAYRLAELLSILGIDIPLGETQTLYASIDDAAGLYSLKASQPQMALGGNSLTGFNVEMSNTGGKPYLDATASLMGYNAGLQAFLQGDSLHADAQIVDPTAAKELQFGDWHLHTRFRQHRGKPMIDLHLDQTQLTFGDSIFVFDDTYLNYSAADSAWRVDQFRVHTDSYNQLVSLQGIVSHKMSDALFINIQGLNSAYIMPMVVREKSFKMGGIVDGWATIYGMLNNPGIEGDVHITDFSMGGEVIGDANGQISFDPHKKKILYQARVADAERERAGLYGEADLQTAKWEINITPNHFPLQFITYWTKNILPEIEGHATGTVKVAGDKGKVYVLTRAKAEDATIRLPWTGCRYHVFDTIIMDSTSIRFPHMILKDDDGNPIEFEGVITHDQFQKFGFHLVAKPHRGMVLDLPYKAGETMQGRVYAEGAAYIDGDERLISITADAKTAGKSQFRFSLGSASTASETNFVHFEDSLRTHLDTAAIRQWRDTVSADSLRKRMRLPETDSRFKIALNIDMTPQLNFQLMLDERTGDMIQARGEGALRFTYDSHTEDYSLMGTFTAESGSLGFTLANVIRREFSIGSGSTIVWNGDPGNPVLDVTAKYHVTANLRDLFGEEISSIGVNRTSVPVNTCLNITGGLNNPILKFGIELPMSEENIQQAVRAVINTEEMLMRQVVYLLVFGRFFTPEYMATTTENYGLNETYSFISSTVTGQINNWLGKLTDMLTLGVQIRSEGSGATASQEYEAQFQLQPVDRLIINGNVGYRYNDISNRPFFGDLDAEVLLTNDGQLRLKAYTHTVDKYSLRQANTIQGIGFVWRYNFNIPSKDQRKQIRAERKARKAMLKEAKKAKKAQKNQK